MTFSRQAEIIQLEKPGFNCIRFEITPTNKPLLEFTMPNTPDNQLYLQQGSTRFGTQKDNNGNTVFVKYIPGGQPIAAAGNISIDKQLIKVIVIGKSPSHLALEYFLEEMNNYSSRLSTAMKCSILSQFQFEILSLIHNKATPVSRFSKKRAEYDMPPSTNKHRIAYRIGGDGSEYLYKNVRNENKCNRKSAEVEAAAAACYALLIGQKAIPKTYTVYDENASEISGSISRIIKNFKPGRDYLKSCDFTSTRNKQQIFGELINAGIVPILVASYILEENDLHDDNWGFNKDGKIARFDFNRSFWPLSCKYLSTMPNELISFVEAELSYLAVKPIDAFELTANEILNFPILSTSKPSNWITGKRYHSTEQDLSDISQSKGFIKQKWKYFLKAILVPMPVFSEIFNGSFGSEKTAKKFTNHLSKRLSNLEDILLSIKDFRQYLIKNNDTIDEIISELERYNKGLETKHTSLKVDIDAVTNKIYTTLSLVELVENGPAPEITPKHQKEAAPHRSHHHSTLFSTANKKTKPSESPTSNETKPINATWSKL